MTREELQKKVNSINSKCKNDFRLDIQTYLLWSRKRQDLIKDIKLKNNYILRTTLLYCYDNTITLDIDLMKPESDVNKSVVMYSKSICYSDNDKIKHERKDMKLLYNLTQSLSDDVILSLARNNCHDFLLKHIELA